MSKREKRSTKPSTRPAVRPEPVTEQDKLSFFQQHFTTAAITALVGGLISLTTVCAVYLYNAGRYMRDVQDPLEQSLEDDRDQMDLAKQFTDRADDAVSRNNAAALEYFSRHTWYKQHYYRDPKLRQEALATAALAVQKADDDLGSISVYPDGVTLIRKVYATAATNYLRSDIAVWNSLTALAEVQTPAEEQKSFDNLLNKWAALAGALSSFQSSRAVVVNSLERRELEEKRAYEKQVRDFHGLLRKHELATVGRGVSVAALS